MKILKNGEERKQKNPLRLCEKFSFKKSLLSFESDDYYSKVMVFVKKIN